jgi:DNA-binding Xre family transcriptional regulator
MDKLHKQIVKGFGNHDVSPASMAYKMMRESTYVNESVLQYMINYIHIMANAKVIPMHLADIREICRYLDVSLQELGLVGEVGRTPEINNEYLAL